MTISRNVVIALVLCCVILVEVHAVLFYVCDILTWSGCGSGHHHLTEHAASVNSEGLADVAPQIPTKDVVVGDSSDSTSDVSDDDDSSGNASDDSQSVSSGGSESGDQDADDVDEDDREIEREEKEEEKRREESAKALPTNIGGKCHLPSSLPVGAVATGSPSSKPTTDVDGHIWAEESLEDRMRRMKTPQRPRVDSMGVEIDFVFKWVDGDRDVHKKKKHYWSEVLSKEYKHFLSPAGVKCPAIDSQQNSVRRERDNHELLYAVRSVVDHAPWFRHIFIVVEGPHMLPTWLDPDNPNISVIYHTDIFPEPLGMYLPTFSGHTVASVLHRIPCLSENFVAMDDDYFFTRDVRPNQLFKFKGKQLVGPTALFEGAWSRSRPMGGQAVLRKHHHVACNVNSATMVDKYGKKVGAGPVKDFFQLRHAPYVSSISSYQYILEEIFPEETAALRTHRFRTKADFHAQSLVAHLSMKAGSYKLVGNVKPVSKGMIKPAFRAFDAKKGLEQFKKFETTAREVDFMCINDNNKEDVADAFFRRMVKFYKNVWPVPSPFEDKAVVDEYEKTGM